LVVKKQVHLKVRSCFASWKYPWLRYCYVCTSS